jgi:ring-1,2-phenylacetyl-CoA epoxidase subunit PaaD
MFESLVPAVTITLDSQQSRVHNAWRVLHSVLDPEVPALSVCDLGIVRDVREDGDTLCVDLTPTYSGCPATEVIELHCVQALEAAGLGPVQARTVLSPAWTSDWISAEGREKLRAYGIAPPGRCGHGGDGIQQGLAAGASAVVQFFPRQASGSTMSANAAASAATAAVVCPRCQSHNTERLSAFGATACKSLWRCRACREPFEAFKSI